LRIVGVPDFAYIHNLRIASHERAKPAIRIPNGRAEDVEAINKRANVKAVSATDYQDREFEGVNAFLLCLCKHSDLIVNSDRTAPERGA